MRGEGNLCIYHEEVDIGRDRDSERLLQPENFEWRAVNEGVCRRLLAVEHTVTTPQHVTSKPNAYWSIHHILCSILQYEILLV